MGLFLKRYDASEFADSTRVEMTSSQCILIVVNTQYIARIQLSRETIEAIV